MSAASDAAADTWQCVPKALELLDVLSHVLSRVAALRQVAKPHQSAPPAERRPPW